MLYERQNELCELKVSKQESVFFENISDTDASFSLWENDTNLNKVTETNHFDFLTLASVHLWHKFILILFLLNIFSAYKIRY